MGKSWLCKLYSQRIGPPAGCNLVCRDILHVNFCNNAQCKPTGWQPYLNELESCHGLDKLTKHQQLSRSCVCCFIRRQRCIRVGCLVVIIL